MKTPASHAVKMLFPLALLLASGFGTEPVLAQPAPAKPAASAAPQLKFRPPTTGAASVRVTGGSRGFRPPTTGAASVRATGGSRGTEATTITLDVLAPDDIGTTTQEQPSLFWFQSQPADAKFELTLLQEKQVKPLVQVKVAQASQAGIQRLKLADHGVKLTPGVEYQWVVALVTDPENRSTDLVASGAIKRIEPSADVKQKVSQAAPASLAGIYADAGIWYDALAAISDQVEAQPGDSTARQMRADLLRQVGLTAAAQADVSK
jgi:hypothetical protein